MATRTSRTVAASPELVDAAAGPQVSAVAWPAVFAGTTVAVGASLILLTLGSAFGLAEVSPWPGVGAKPTSFTIGAGVWLIVMQWISSALGGYVAGRLRTRWPGLHTDEVFFRDTAHGLLTWATATIVVVAVSVVAAALSAAATPAASVNLSADAVEAARKTAAAFATFTGVAMLVGAFIASVSGAIGGDLRDKHP